MATVHTWATPIRAEPKAIETRCCSALGIAGGTPIRAEPKAIETVVASCASRTAMHPNQSRTKGD